MPGPAHASSAARARRDRGCRKMCLPRWRRGSALEPCCTFDETLAQVLPAKLAVLAVVPVVSSQGATPHPRDIIIRPNGRFTYPVGRKWPNWTIIPIGHSDGADEWSSEPKGRHPTLAGQFGLPGDGCQRRGRQPRHYRSAANDELPGRRERGD